MQINYVKGDLFQTGCDVIAHGCNAQGVMGRGVAKTLRQIFPEAYNEYRKTYLNDGLTVGSVHFVKLPGRIIANCITQEFYSGKKENHIYIDYKAIKKCMWILNSECSKNNWSLAMPLIGAGLGGGDWDKIEKIIEKEFTDVIPNVYVL